MIDSLSELKKDLNINTISVEWNTDFPLENLSTYVNDDLRQSYQKFVSLVKDTLISQDESSILINQCNMKDIADIALKCGFVICYFVGENPDTLELGVFKHFENKQDWCRLFKSRITRNQFFSLIHTFDSIIPCKKLFQDSKVYQIIPPKLPLGYNVKFGVLGGEYIYVVYFREFEKPIYKIIKIDDNQILEFIPEIEVDRGKFSYVKLNFDDRIFIGDSIHTLQESSQKSNNKRDSISVFINNKFYTLYPSSGYIELPNSVEKIERFNLVSNIKCIYEDIYSDGYKYFKYIVLRNGSLWIPEKYSVIQLNKFISFDLQIFQLSSKNGGIVLYHDNIIELVSIESFHQFLIGLLKLSQRLRYVSDKERISV